MRIILVLLSCSIYFNLGYCIDRLAIADRGPNGQGHFYNTQTNEVVPLRGANYIRLTTVNNRTYHSTLSVGYYNSKDAENMLAHFESGGYNVVRVFIDRGDWNPYNWDHSVAGDFNTQIGLNQNYMDNVADFVYRASLRNIYVIPVLVGIPYNKFFYDNYVNSDPKTYQTGNPNNPVNGPNAHYMALGLYRAKLQYVGRFLRQLYGRLDTSTTKAILALAFENEAYFSTDFAPFNQMSGTVTTLDGMTYDMSIPFDRQQAADSNVNHWINGLHAEVKRYDQELLTTIGAYTFNAIKRQGPNGLMPAPGATDSRYPIRPRMVTSFSNIDFMDLHTYPVDRLHNTPYSIHTDLASSEYSEVYGPVIMGEFGAFEPQYPSITNAANVVKNHQISSCGYNFSGWIFWTYDTSFAEQPDGPFHNMRHGADTIFNTLAPVNMPDPCSP